MTDRKGNTLAVGDRVYLLPDAHTRTGGAGWVRDIRSDARGDKARVDDGGKEDRGGDWDWSAWARSSEVEKIDAVAPAKA